MRKTRSIIAFVMAFLIIFVQDSEVFAAVVENVSLGSISSSILPNAADKNTNANSSNKLEEEKQKAFNHEKELEEMVKKQVVAKRNIENTIQTPSIISVKSLSQNTNIINWSYDKSAEYQLEVDGKVTDLKSQQGYIHKFDSKVISHTYRVRSKYEDQYSEWSEPFSKVTEAGKTAADTRTPSKEGFTPTITTQSISSTAEFMKAMYSIHIKGGNWYELDNGETLGFTGEKIDEIKIRLENAPDGLSIKYKGYVDGEGWNDWVKDGAICGIPNKGLQGIQVALEGKNDAYSVQYILICSDRSNAATMSSNGTSGYSDIPNEGLAPASLLGKGCEAFQVNIVNANEYHTEFITSNTVWKARTDPYIIDGQLIINQGATLTIDKGAKVVFQKYKYRQNGIALSPIK